jgi:hypothetical protein
MAPYGRRSGGVWAGAWADEALAGYWQMEVLLDQRTGQPQCLEQLKKKLVVSFQKLLIYQNFKLKNF